MNFKLFLFYLIFNTSLKSYSRIYNFECNIREDNSESIIKFQFPDKLHRDVLPYGKVKGYSYTQIGNKRKTVYPSLDLTTEEEVEEELLIFFKDLRYFLSIMPNKKNSTIKERNVIIKFEKGNIVSLIYPNKLKVSLYNYEISNNVKFPKKIITIFQGEKTTFEILNISFNKDSISKYFKELEKNG